MSATLGGLIKDYRLQKNISQLEVAFALGWKETSRLSRIEQGRVGNPSRELIDRIIEAMKLTEEEKNDLLYTGNYLPTDEEIAKVQKEIRPELEKWPYPIIIYDFSWRVIDENTQSFIVYNSTLSNKRRERKYINHIFEVIFAPNYPQNVFLKGEEIKKLHSYLLTLLIRFKHEQRFRTKEDWYIKLIKRMMVNELFRKLWMEAQNKRYQEITTNFLRETVVSPFDESKRLNVDTFTVSLFTDSRFEIDYYVPADIETFEFFNKKDLRK